MTEKERSITASLLTRINKPYTELEAFVWFCHNGYSGDDAKIAEELGVSISLLDEWLADFGVRRRQVRREEPSVMLLNDSIQSYDNLGIAHITTEQWMNAYKTKKDDAGNDISSDNASFVGFQMWLRTSCPYCSNPKNMRQLTFENFTKLKNVYMYTSNEIRDIMVQMENRKDCRARYTDLYASLLNWLKNNYGDRRVK